MNDLGKRLLFRLVRILLIAAILMTALVLLHPERYLPADGQVDSVDGLQGALMVALALAAVGMRWWWSERLRRKRSGK